LLYAEDKICSMSSIVASSESQIELWHAISSSFAYVNSQDWIGFCTS
jgi:hypothetical protein